ncbi:hypothetical protein BGX33_009512 [Mortierella sp. NVP41]|nr:hypothetical protein BGX33_009512 [Mortierella sp. NVP41]
MAGHRTRISARLQPVAAALASAPNSASLATVLASIAGTSTRATRPARPTRTTPNSRQRASSRNIPQTEQELTATSATQPPLPIVTPTTSTQEATMNDNNLIGLGVDSSPPALSTVTAFPDPETTHIRKKRRTNDNNAGSGTESTTTTAAEGASTSTASTTGDPGSASASSSSGATLSSTTEEDVLMDLVPLEDSGDVWMGDAPTSEDNVAGGTDAAVQADTTALVDTLATPDATPTFDMTAPLVTSIPSIEPATMLSTTTPPALNLTTDNDSAMAPDTVVPLVTDAPSIEPAAAASTTTPPTLGLTADDAGAIVLDTTGTTDTAAPLVTPPNEPATEPATEPIAATPPTVDLTTDNDSAITPDNAGSMHTELEIIEIKSTPPPDLSAQRDTQPPPPPPIRKVRPNKSSTSSLPLTVRLKRQAAEALERRKKGSSSSSSSSTPPARSPQPPPLPLPLPKLQREIEVLTEEQQRERQQLLSNRATNPLELPEIRTNIARFLSRKDLRSCLLVSEGWWESFHPALWADLRPVYRNVLGSMHDYPSAKLMRKNSHLVRTFEYNGHGTVLTSMVPSVHSQYKDEEIEWRRSRAEEEEEERWTYVDDDAAVDGEMGMDLDESLSDFERRIESRRSQRVSQRAQVQDIIASNKRQNEISRFLNDDTDYSKRTCRQLERLILTDKRFSREWGCHYKYWLKLIQLNSATLRALELHYAIRSMDALRDFYTSVIALDNLTELILVDNDIDAQNTKPFLEMVCPRLRKLELRKVRIEFGPFLTQQATPNDCAIVAMPQMRSLTMNQVHARSATFAIDFLRMCPNLVELDYRPQWGMVVKSFTDTLAEKLPSLTHLSFRLQGVSDLDVSSMVKAVPDLQKLDISGCVFGLMAANNLTTRHLFTVTYLDIRNCAQVTGTLIQRVLGECRNLRSFMADHIRAKEIVNNSVYPDWACIGLQELTLDIRGSPQDRETTMKVYRQLAVLECLEYLDISRTSVIDIPPTDKEGSSNCLTLGLDSGLKVLKTLKHLHTLIYRGISHNEVGLVELQWMALAWPRLGNLGGKLVERKSLRYNHNVHPKIAAGAPTPAENDVGAGGSLPAESASSGSGSGTDVGTNSITSTDAGSSTSAGVGTGGSSGSGLLFPSRFHVRAVHHSAGSTNPSINTTTGTSAGRATGTGTATQTDGRRTVHRVPPEAPIGHLGTTLRQLRLHHRIQVVPHPEDKISAATRKRQKLMLVGDSSDEERDRERDRPRAGQIDPRYRLDFRDWLLVS